jgi:putative tricarboxylic transport membrane protein
MSDDAPASGDELGRGFLPRRFYVRSGELCTALALAAVGLFFTWQASLLDLGGFGLPGPGFFPLALGASLLLFSVMIAVERWREPASGKTVELGHRNVLIAFVALLATSLLFETLGAYITLGLFGAALLIFIGRVPLWIAGPAAVIAMVACWYFFQVLLGLQLPTGPF